MKTPLCVTIQLYVYAEYENDLRDNATQYKITVSGPTGGTSSMRASGSIKSALGIASQTANDMLQDHIRYELRTESEG